MNSVESRQSEKCFQSILTSLNCKWSQNICLNIYIIFNKMYSSPSFLAANLKTIKIKTTPRIFYVVSDSFLALVSQTLHKLPC